MKIECRMQNAERTGVVVSALVLLLGGCGGGREGGGKDPAFSLFTALPVERRQAVPTFDLERMGGGRLRLEEYRGRIVLLNIWASWCGPCRAEMPELDALARELTDGTFAFLTVTDDVERDRAVAFAAELAFDHPVGFGDGRLRARYAGFGLPLTLLLDADGRAMYRWHGYGGTAQMDAIRRMVEEERRRDRG
jgi:thiol-disulfide isomerase/thioredoxin